jgi:hypothetical protein
MRILYKFLHKGTVLFLGVPLGFMVIAGTLLGLIWEAFKFGFTTQADEVYNKLVEWDDE